MASGLTDLAALHHEEVAHPGEPPLDIDWPKLLMLQRLEAHRSVSVRVGGKLVGYRGFFIDYALHYKTIRWAVNDALYLDPDYRKGRLGRRLIEASDAMLKEEGFTIVIQADRKAHKLDTGRPHATLGDLLRRIGYGPLETVWAKRL